MLKIVRVRKGVRGLFSFFFRRVILSGGRLSFTFPTCLVFLSLSCLVLHEESLVIGDYLLFTADEGDRERLIETLLSKHLNENSQKNSFHCPI